MRRRGDLAGNATADVLLLLAAMAFGLAVAYPAIEREQVRREVDAAVADVEAVRAAAVRYRERTGTWPPAARARALPAALAGALPSSADAGPRRYRLEWRVWELLEGLTAPVTPEPPDPAETTEAPETPSQLPAPDSLVRTQPAIGTLGGIEVHSDDAHVLAELLLRYATQRSFVRDSTWTLVLTGIRRRQ